MKIFLRNITALLVFFVVAIFVAEKSELSLIKKVEKEASVGSALLPSEKIFFGYVSNSSNLVFKDGPFSLENYLKEDWVRGDEWQKIRLINSTSTIYEESLVEADGLANYIFADDYAISSDGSVFLLFRKKIVGSPDCLFIDEIKDGEETEIILVPVSCDQKSRVIQNGQNREVYLLGYNNGELELIEYAREGSWNKVSLLLKGLSLGDIKSIRLLKPWDDGFDQAVIRGTAEGGPTPLNICINLTDVDVCATNKF